MTYHRPFSGIFSFVIVLFMSCRTTIFRHASSSSTSAATFVAATTSSTAWYDRLISSLPPLKTDPPPSPSLPCFSDDGRRILRVAAPMVSQSDYAFRRMTREYGCDVAYTQMIHAGNICRAAKLEPWKIQKKIRGQRRRLKNMHPEAQERDIAHEKTNMFIQNHLDVMEDEISAMDSLCDIRDQNNENDTTNLLHKSSPQHVIVQLAGSSPEVVSEAGLHILQYVADQNKNDNDTSGAVKNRRHPLANIAALDLNLGCPQKIASKGNYGAFLLQDPELLLSILKQLVDTIHRATDGQVGVTAKIRVLEDDAATLDLVRKMADTGIDLLTVHGRTVRENKTATGPARWNVVRKIVEAVGRESSYGLPIISNGGVGCPADVLACVRHTGADGVMSSEALLEDPSLFDINHPMLAADDSTVDFFAEASASGARICLLGTKVSPAK
mmetsp:Transcript_20788/g.47192  ORF Transcript_20788/g.47192 Transcript_20788/m.47192 type:complete len:442 (-) Transcript_20788:445-1770(-)